MFKEYDAVLEVRVIKKKVKGLLDAAALLWRLEMADVSVGEERWEKVTHGMMDHLYNHRSPWYVYNG